MRLVLIFFAVQSTIVFVRAETEIKKKASDGGVAPYLDLNDGLTIPALGLGTWLGLDNQRVKGDENAVEQAVEWALDAGYRHFDTASIYKTEEQVGRAIRNKIAEGVIKREDVFVTTKLWNDRHLRSDVVPALRESLARLGLSYVDLYLIHWPIATYANGSLQDVDYLETWQGMADARRLGLARSIGVSNFNQSMIVRILSNPGPPPAVLQVEINLTLQQLKLLEFCRHARIVVTGYSPFGALFGNRVSQGRDAPPPRADDPALQQLATAHNCTVPQIALRYLVELGVVPIPKSLHQDRIKENIDVFHFQLSEDDRQLLRSFDRGYRTIEPTHWRNSPYYPFQEQQKQVSAPTTPKHL